MPCAGALLCLASAAAFGAMGIFGKLAYEEGATVGTLLAARFALAAALFWLLVRRRAARAAARAVAPRRRPRAGARRRRVRRPGRRLLRRAGPPRRVAARAARLHLPGHRDRDRDRAGARRAEPAHRRRAGAGVGRARPGAGRRGRRARSTRSGPCSGSAAAVIYSVYILASEGIAARVGPLALTTLVCTGAAVSLTLGGIAGGDLDPAARERGRARLAGRHRRRLDRRRRRPVLRRAAAGRARRPLDPVDPRAGGHRRRWHSSCSASRSAPCSWPAACSCCWRCSPCARRPRIPAPTPAAAQEGAR